MSALYEIYGAVPGTDAFLSGTVSTLSDVYLTEIIPQYWAVEADVFEANKTVLCEKLRKRLHEYLQVQTSDDKTVEHVNRLDFELELVDGDLFSAIKAIINEPCFQISEAKKNIDNFLESVRFYLGESHNIYRIKRLNECNSAALSDFYTYIVFDVVFIEYECHMLMIVFGSDE